MLDVPGADTGQLIDWGNQMIGNTDPDYADVAAHRRRRATSTGTCRSARPPPSRSSSTAASWPHERRGGDGDDLISKLVNRTPGGRRAVDRDAISTTTSCCWSSPATRRPGTRSATRCSPSSSTPTSWPCSRSGPSSSRPPSRSCCAGPRRSTTSGAPRPGTSSCAGRQIKAGDKVVMWFASGNRDEEVFGNPYRFDVTRTPQRPRHASARAARTSAWATTWPGWRSG